MIHRIARQARPLLIAAAMAILGLSAQAQTTLRVGFGLGLDAHYGLGAVQMQKLVAERMGGRFKLELFPSFQLGGEREMTEGAQLGTIDIVITSTGPVGNFVPDTLITDIPFLFRDYGHARSVLDGPIGQSILDKCPAKGLICLAWTENGFRHMTNSKREVKAPEDAKGLKIRTMENQIHMQAFRALGVLPTPMAFPEVFNALQTGTVDGQENPIGVIVSAKLNQVQKHLTLTGHVYSPGLVLMAPAAYNKMSEADRKAIAEIAREGARVTRQRVEQLERDGVDQLRAAGMQVRSLNVAEKSGFQNALNPAFAEFAKRFGQANIDAIRNAK
ncbi:MAG: TRAP transporter substrate-binding protein [Betaproteobacteria bacterium]